MKFEIIVDGEENGAIYGSMYFRGHPSVDFKFCIYDEIPQGMVFRLGWKNICEGIAMYDVVLRDNWLLLKPDNERLENLLHDAFIFLKLNFNNYAVERAQKNCQSCMDMITAKRSKREQGNE